MSNGTRGGTPAGYVNVQLPVASLQVVSAGPRLVSQKTSLDVLGMPSNHFITTFKAYEAEGKPTIRDRRLMLVELEPFVEWLRERTEAKAVRAKANADEVEHAADELAADLGLRVVGGDR